MKRLAYAPTIVAAALLAALPMTVSATPSPSPSLDTLLVAPPATDFNQLTTSPLHGTFTAHDFATLNGPSTAATNTENTLNHEGFIQGYAQTWTQASSGHGLIEAVMAFTGGQGAGRALTALESGDKSDPNYKRANSITGISRYYGAHFVDMTNNVIEDLFSFVKGNDLFAILFVSSKDDVADAAASQTRAQYAAAPDLTVPTTQWPENAASPSSFPVGAFLLGVGFIVVVLVLVAVLVLRRRGTPPMAYAGQYGMAAVPGAAAPGAFAPGMVTPDAVAAAAVAQAPVAPMPEVQMSPDGNYWWDGQAWRDASQEAPPHAQRSSDGNYWWDGRTWRLVPQASPPVG